MYCYIHLLCGVHCDVSSSRGGYVSSLHASLSWNSGYESHQFVYGNNFGSIQSASIPDSELKKKHVAISYHFVQEAITAKIVNTIWVPTHANFADVCMKALGPMAYNALVSELMTH